MSLLFRLFISLWHKLERNLFFLRIFITFVVLISIFIKTATAQNETNIWYFGNNAGLDFKTGLPEPLTNSAMRIYEGCAVVSNENGELLFYTNGVSVWNARHEVMQNGTQLAGDTSATQSAVIVPHPGEDEVYYLFTVDILNFVNQEVITKGLCYSIIDMRLDEGQGAVLQKNISLQALVPEKLTVVKKNDEEYWLVSHEWGTNNFLSWLIDENGLNTEPVISSAGTPHEQIQDHNIINSIGVMKTNPQADRLALALLRASLVEVFNFDKETGIVSDAITIAFDYEAVYGVEFSPDGSKLYITSIESLYQVDLNAGTETDVINSLTKIYEESYYMGTMQIAGNGKIYCTVDESEYLGVINKPNEQGLACEYKSEALYLAGKQSRLGLPNFPASYFLPPSFYAYPTCYGTETFFTPADTVGLDSITWDFGDMTSGSNNSSSLFHPAHLYDNVGEYIVKMTSWKDGNAVENIKGIEIEYGFEFNLGADTVICGQDSYLLQIKDKNRNYQWFDGTAASEYLFTQDGTYTAEAISVYTNCKNSDTISIKFSPLPQVDLGKDSFFCSNDNFKLTPITDCDTCTYLWSNGETSKNINLNSTNTYWLRLTNAYGCLNSDTVYYSMHHPPLFSLGNDTVLCEDDYLSLELDFQDAEYRWQDGSTGAIFEVSRAGVYSVEALNVCGIHRDSILIEYKYCGPVVIPNIITPNQDGVNDYFLIKGIEELPWELTIYSRWGTQVYYSPDYRNDWQAANLTDGVYFYILSCREAKNEYKGFVHVVR